MVDVALYVWVLTLAGMTGLSGVSGFVLYRDAKLAGTVHRRAVGLGVAVVVALGAWFAVAGVIAAHDGYLSGHGHISGLPFAFAGSLIALPAATRIPLVARAHARPRHGIDPGDPHGLPRHQRDTVRTGHHRTTTRPDPHGCRPTAAHPAHHLRRHDIRIQGESK